MQIIHADQALTPDGWVQDVQITIDAGRISGIGAQTDAPHHRLGLALAAPTNLHSHAFQRAMAGLTETRGPDPRDTFWTWRRLMYRFLDQLTPDQIEAIAALVFMEMQEAGYAAVCEFHYLHHAAGGQAYADLAELSLRVIAAAQETGIGLTLLPVLYEQGGCDGRPLQGGQLRFANTPDRFCDLHAKAGQALTLPDTRLGTAPHSLRAVSRAGLAQAVGLGGPTHMHLAEQTAEVDEVLAAYGARPAEWLMANHAVGADWCLIHCTQMTDAETRALAATGAVAGLCPITESNLGDGIFPATTFLAANGRVGFGSDSNIHITLFEELKTLEYSQRLRDRGRAVLASPAQSTGRVLYDHAARFGAQAAGRASGTLAVGKWADILGLACDTLHLDGRQGDALLDTLIFGGHGASHVTDLWSAGRHSVQNGRHMARDGIVARYRTTMAQLQQVI